MLKLFIMVPVWFVCCDHDDGHAALPLIGDSRNAILRFGRLASSIEHLLLSFRCLIVRTSSNTTMPFAATDNSIKVSKRSYICLEEIPALAGDAREQHHSGEYSP
jgi:hypothetical protein